MISSDDFSAGGATDRWATFPVSEVPRPLVLVGPPIVVKEGFAGPSEIMFALGRVDEDESVPTDVLDILRTPRHRVEHPPSRANVRVKNARISTCDFLTDRGPKQFVAWQMESEELVGPLWVLDPPIASLAWSPTSTSARRMEGRGRAGKVSKDDREIIFEFVGGIPDRVDYPSADVVESDTAVAIVPISACHPPFEPQQYAGEAWAGLVCTRSITAHLGEPLGARVLLDIDGCAVAATPTG